MDPISLTLPAMKQYLRVDYAEEDTLIEGLILAAVDYICGYCGIDPTTDPKTLPETLKQAVCLMVGTWFDNRAAEESKFASSSKVVPDSAHRLMWMYRTVQI